MDALSCGPLPSLHDHEGLTGVGHSESPYATMPGNAGAGPGLNLGYYMTHNEAGNSYTTASPFIAANPDDFEAETQINEFTIRRERVIGRGQFSHVYKGKRANKCIECP